MTDVFTFTEFESEGEPYVRYRLQNGMYNEERAKAAAAWLDAKEQEHAGLAERRSKKIRWIIGGVGALVVAALAAHLRRR